MWKWSPSLLQGQHHCFYSLLSFVAVLLAAVAFATMLRLYRFHICLEFSTEGEINSVRGVKAFLC